MVRLFLAFNLLCSEQRPNTFPFHAAAVRTVRIKINVLIFVTLHALGSSAHICLCCQDMTLAFAPLSPLTLSSWNNCARPQQRILITEHLHCTLICCFKCMHVDHFRADVAYSMGHFLT